jgi:hypothetical protein
MLRVVIGFVVGLVVWMPVFFGLARLIALVWPEYAANGRVWFETGRYDFPAPMSVVNVVCWALAATVAGWLAAAIARRSEAAWALSVALALYLGVLHLWLYRPNFPGWYNVAVPLVAALGAAAGGSLARNRTTPRVTAR